jgi:hypothetical protein
MDSRQFDQIAKAQAARGSRRQAVRLLVSSVLAPVLALVRRHDAAAACRGFNQPCGKNAPCCPGSGLRCENGHCRCREGTRHCLPGPICQNLETSPAHCGGCGQTCPAHKPCCINGTCRPKCGAVCCADCFIEVSSIGVIQAGSEVCCGGAAGTICSKKNGPNDDRCCYPDQRCLKGRCCDLGKFGTVNCSGRCCAKAACCNGKCCRNGFVCARRHGENKQHCARANRVCSGNGQCHANEICHGGTCCSGNRICLTVGNGAPVCCRADEYCEFQGTLAARCAPLHESTSTTRGHRIRP